jgi:hypothetical protein
MHAALLTLTIDPDQAPAAANALTRDILPKIRSAPGFVAGYWLEPVDGRGFSFVVFETEEQARRSAPPASNWAAPRRQHQRGGLPASGCQRLEVVSD